MKIIAIPDVHGRKWWRDILESEDFDLVVFLGDYVSTHEDISSNAQIENLKDVLTYKEENPDKVILLRGNHDLQHLGYYWAECSGLFRQVQRYMSTQDVRSRFLNDTQWIYTHDNILFSHAGVTKTWFERTGIKSIEEINDLKPSELFGFFAGEDNPYDCYGDSKYQPCTWVRPLKLYSDNYGDYTQVVGHTTYDKIWTTEEQNIWFCDCNLQEYLCIENGQFQAKKIPPLK